MLNGAVPDHTKSTPEGYYPKYERVLSQNYFIYAQTANPTSHPRIVYKLEGSKAIKTVYFNNR